MRQRRGGAAARRTAEMGRRNWACGAGFAEGAYSTAPHGATVYQLVPRSNHEARTRRSHVHPAVGAPAQTALRRPGGSLLALLSAGGCAHTRDSGRSSLNPAQSGQVTNLEMEPVQIEVGRGANGSDELVAFDAPTLFKRAARIWTAIVSPRR